jgi:hypothetical protein
VLSNELGCCDIGKTEFHIQKTTALAIFPNLSSSSFLKNISKILNRSWIMRWGLKKNARGDAGIYTGISIAHQVSENPNI